MDEADKWKVEGSDRKIEKDYKQLIEENGNRKLKNGDNRVLKSGDNRKLESGDNRKLEGGDTRKLEDGDTRKLEGGDNRKLVDGDTRKLVTNLHSSAEWIKEASDRLQSISQLPFSPQQVLARRPVFEVAVKASKMKKNFLYNYLSFY